MPRSSRQGHIFKRNERPLKFDQKLILNQWILSLFEVSDFNQLTESLKIPDFEGFSDDNISHYYYVLSQLLFERKELPSDILLGYDQNIVRHWKKITEKRNLAGHVLNPKYFQYLSLLFAEIYLDRYFRDSTALLNNLNNYVDAFNNGKTERDKVEHNMMLKTLISSHSGVQLGLAKPF